MRTNVRYEVQVAHHAYGWVEAGSWPASTKAQGLQSLARASRNDSKAYRLVKLIPVVVARVKAKSFPTQEPPR